MASGRGETLQNAVDWNRQIDVLRSAVFIGDICVEQLSIEIEADRQIPPVNISEHVPFWQSHKFGRLSQRIKLLEFGHPVHSFVRPSTLVLGQPGEGARRSDRKST